MGNFARDLRGSATLEFLIVLPMLIWSMLAISLFFDAFRARSTNLKAAYTISDLISRENPFVGPDYIAGLNTMYTFLSASNNPTWIRVSVVQFDTEDPQIDTDGVLILKWSHGTNGQPDLTDATLSDIASKIPVMGHGDSLILVETHMKYRALAKINFNGASFDNFIATRPRFTPPKWDEAY
ncbi:hypothetical protein JI58_05710 [Marinosulfonomonas sp. PRT-SC04]|nr:hypothetical protein JI58_05710 [Marinosulfonomonas sp. PRT-SC04]